LTSCGAGKRLGVEDAKTRLSLPVDPVCFQLLGEKVMSGRTIKINCKP
jgi:hypothetical protein